MLIGGTAGSQTLPTGDAAAFHQRLKELRESVAFAALQGTVRIEASHDGQAARNDFGAMVSLMVNAPFSLQTGSGATSAASLLGNAHTSLYTQWNADRGLSQEQRDRGEGNFSDAYLRDRAQMLNVLVARNLDDVAGVITGRPVSENAQYFDDASDTEVLVGATSRRQFYFGDNQDNSREGGGLADRLYGGAEHNDAIDAISSDGCRTGGNDCNLVLMPIARQRHGFLCNTMQYINTAVHQ